MRINSVNSNNIINAYKKNTKNDISKQTKSSDSVEISSLGKSFSEFSLDKTFNSKEKIEKLKNSIEQETYNIDSTVLAKKLLNYIKETK